MTSIYFPETYLDSRNYFHDQLDRIKSVWPKAILDRHFISQEEDLSIDWIDTDPDRKKEKLLVLTTGLHGVEGFVGAAMLDVFLKEYLPAVNPDDTALILVHALNPWGMANYRRYNRNNVDLNRNFMNDSADFQTVFNANYLKLDSVLNPEHPLKSIWREDLSFVKTVVIGLAKYGVRSFREAVLLGQQSNPKGLYYSGREYQAETLWVRELIADIFSHYKQILHLDMHTGYGPSDQMSLVIAPSEPRDSVQLADDFNLPLVNKADPDQFYKMQGDMVNWIYQYKEKNHPEAKLFSAACEFGTYGDGVPREVLSLRTIIYNNQADQQGTISEAVRQRIQNKIVEMFFPSSITWREKAVADCRQAFEGVLSAEGFISSITGR
jgi:hypothetical protein